MFENVLEGNSVNFLISFLAGTASFFASCLLPLVPTYLAYLSGVSITPSDDEQENRSVFSAALFFVTGFILTFMILSLAFTKITIWLNQFGTIITFMAGAVFILLGLYNLGLFNNTYIATERKIRVGNFLSKYKKLHALIAGTAFGFGWSPCIGPVLAVILYITSKEQNYLYGTSMLLGYGLGLGLPFLVIAAGFEKIVPVLKKYSKAAKYFNYISGAVILAAGILMILGKFEQASSYIMLLFK